MWSGGFNFKITNVSFNLRWWLFVAFPIKENQKESAGWFFWWQYFLMTVASISLYFNGFSVRIDLPKCSYWRTRRLADVNIIADVALIFINNIWIHINRDLIHEKKCITNFVPWSEHNIQFHFFTTCSKYIYQLRLALQRNFTLNKNSKQMKISFLSQMVLEDLRVMNSLSKNFLV